MCDGPWYNPKICSQFYGSSFENFFRTVSKYRYDIMYTIDMYCNMNPEEPDYEISGDGRPITND